jgi:thioredoxin-like negative regulator of GroEL
MGAFSGGWKRVSIPSTYNKTCSEKSRNDVDDRSTYTTVRLLLSKSLFAFMPDAENAHSFTFDELREAVRQQSGDTPIVVDFWEPRCTACRATLNTIDDLACRIDDSGVVGTFNVREEPEAARSLGVETVPTLIVFRGGEVDSVLRGAEKIQTFVERIDEEVFFGSPPTCET